MQPQMLLQNKTFVADIASVGFLTRMDSIVLVEAAHVGELFIADITDRLVSGVGQVVFLQGVGVGEQFVANIALVGVLTSMDEVVAFEVSSLGKAAITYITNIRLFTRVSDVVVF